MFSQSSPFVLTYQQHCSFLLQNLSECVKLQSLRRWGHPPSFDKALNRVDVLNTSVIQYHSSYWEQCKESFLFVLFNASMWMLAEALSVNILYSYISPLLELIFALKLLIKFSFYSGLTSLRFEQQIPFKSISGVAVLKTCYSRKIFTIKTYKLKAFLGSSPPPPWGRS